MTGITRMVVRESDAHIYSQGKSRTIIVEMSPSTRSLIGFRLKGSRRTVRLPIDWCYKEALRNEIARLKDERKNAKRQGAK